MKVLTDDASDPGVASIRLGRVSAALSTALGGRRVVARADECLEAVAARPRALADLGPGGPLAV